MQIIYIIIPSLILLFINTQTIQMSTTVLICEMIAFHFVWNKIVMLYYQKWFYSRQGIPFKKGVIPVLGNLSKIIKTITQYKAVDHPWVINKEEQPAIQTEIHGEFTGSQPVLFINDAKLLEELYAEKNKYFDKDPMFRNLLFPLTGSSSLFAQSDDAWKTKRNSLATNFHSKFLVKYLELIKTVVQKKTIQFRKDYADTGKQVNIMEIVQDTFVQIFLTCAFGLDLNEQKVDYYVEGVKTQRLVGSVLLTVDRLLIKRGFSIQMLLFPSSYNIWLTSSDRELKRNVVALRSLFSSFVKQRRLDKQDPNFVSQGDLLTSLLDDEYFVNDEELIIDECLTLFYAGTQTGAISHSNLFVYLIQKPEYMEKVREEINTILVEPFKKTNPGKVVDLFDLIQHGSIRDMPYFSQCFNESLRIELPLRYATTFMLTKNDTIGKYKILKGTPFHIGMYEVQHNPKEWSEPERFIPERFDPSSKYYLTPSGKRRHPMSFGPFLGGKRACLGKTFIEMGSKVLGVGFLYQFHYEFVDRSLYEEKPSDTLAALRGPEIFVNVQSINDD